MSTGKEFGFPAEDWTGELVRRSLIEDIGSGDVSTEVTVGSDLRAVSEVTARQAGVVAGLPLLEMLFRELDPEVSVSVLMPDGTFVEPGDVVARIEGPAGPLLTGERTALNFLQHLGGIASLTREYVNRVAGTSCLVLDTRKTLPGYRQLAKYAVRCGGGHNHRMGLYDRIMLKDNHWSAGGGSIAELVDRSRLLHPELDLEVEVDTLEQLAVVLPLGVEWILLDNFTPDLTAEAVGLRDSGKSSTLLEASGNVNLDTIAAFARAGVDAASVGRLTHSAPALDLGLDMEKSQ
ncbi:MAG: carboxylating nicotinate-nucleotide diphosphorylase [Gemmatimonadales bacterium]|nr:carboxylating nicotinate-nucleotide diphosphorylase [Gemmatimonadales bacterium]